MTPLISLTKAKEFIGLRTANVEHDATITTLIGAATSEIEFALDRKLTLGLTTEFFNTSHTMYQSLDLYGSSETGIANRATKRTYHLGGLFPDQAQGISVWYDPSYDFLDGTLLTINKDYHIDWDNSLLTVFRGTSDTVKALKVEYTSGIAVAGGTLEAAAPDDLIMACLYQTAYLFKRHRNDNVGLTSDRAVDSQKSNVKAGAWNTRQGLCQEAQGPLRRYKRPIMGRM